MASEAVVKRRVRYWAPKLGLQEWTLYVTFNEEGAKASCASQPEYLEAILNFDLKKIADGDVDAFVVHELMHNLVWGLANCANALARGDKAQEEWVRTEEEELVTRLERLIVGMDK